MPLLSVAVQHILNTAHTVGCAMELVSALIVATILADAAVTPTVSEITYNVSSGMLNDTQPTITPPDSSGYEDCSTNANVLT